MINDLWYKNAVIYCLSVATFMTAVRIVRSGKLGNPRFFTSSFSMSQGTSLILT